MISARIIQQQLLARMESWAIRRKRRAALADQSCAADAGEARRRQRALAILGYGSPAVELSNLTLSPAILHFGDELAFSFELRNKIDEPQNLMIDFVARFLKANGSTSPKVFKLKKMRLPGGETASISKRFAIRPISTRRVLSRAAAAGDPGEWARVGRGRI